MEKEQISLKKKISRALIPRSFVELVLRKLTNRRLRKYQSKYPHLVCRKDTSDHYVFRDIFLLNELVLPVSIHPKLIIDLGAYIGLSAIYYKEAYPDSTLICVEPEDSNFELLKNNTSQFSQVQTIHSGVWSKNVGLKISNQSVEKWAFSLEEVPDGEEYDVFAVTVDSLLENSGFSHIDILKVDIEGAEKQLFSVGCEKWIDKVNILVLELHDRIIPGCSDAVYNALDMSQWTEYRKGEKVIFVRNNRLG